MGPSIKKKGRKERGLEREWQRERKKLLLEVYQSINNNFKVFFIGVCIWGGIAVKCVYKI